MKKNIVIVSIIIIVLCSCQTLKNKRNYKNSYIFSISDTYYTGFVDNQYSAFSYPFQRNKISWFVNIQQMNEYEYLLSISENSREYISNDIIEELDHSREKVETLITKNRSPISSIKKLDAHIELNEEFEVSNIIIENSQSYNNSTLSSESIDYFVSLLFFHDKQKIKYPFTYFYQGYIPMTNEIVLEEIPFTIETGDIKIVSKMNIDLSQSKRSESIGNFLGSITTQGTYFYNGREISIGISQECSIIEKYIKK